MAKKEQKKEAVKDTVKNEPKDKETKGDVTKVKAKMTKKPEVLEETITKVDLSKQPEKEEVTKTIEEKPTEVVQEVVEETPQEQTTTESDTPVKKDEPVIEEVTKEEVKEVAEEVVDAIEESEATGKPLPENVQKLVDFMEETGGDLQDYVKLNRDYSKSNDMEVLEEYYKNTKPHLSSEEIEFLMEDKFSFDQEADEEIDIKRKKLALKEQVADARAHLDRQKSKYYEEIKSGVKLTAEQQKAIDFFNRYNKESKETEKTAKIQKDTFLKKTDQVFNDKFKGFEYNVGEKKYRFNVNNVNEVKENQSNINNFVKKFLNKDQVMEDAKGYHKSLFTAANADAVANHFYEQGKADALKETIAKSKNISTNARGSHGEVEAGGIKVKVLGEDSNDFKFKIRNKNK
jgi:hypothetical protein